MLLPKLIRSTKMTFCAIAFVLVGACESNGFTPIENDVRFDHDGLDGHVITRLYQHGDRTYAATDQGLYFKTLGGQWQSTGLSQGEVLDLAIIDADHHIASVRDTTAGIFNDALLETTDGGQNWHSVEHNFGGETAETLYGLYYDSYNNALYATGVQVLAVSYDDGRSWELLSGAWGSFSQPNHIVKHNPATNEIWYGGQNAIEQMVLRRYSLDTQEEQSFPDLLPAPSVIYGIQFDPENERGVYVSGEGGVLKTEDNGEEWTTLIGDVDYRFYFDIALDPVDPRTLYTGGWDKMDVTVPQPLILEVSTDDGDTWTEHRHPDDTLLGGVRSILATTEDEETVVYLGLYGGGVMRVTFP